MNYTGEIRDLSAGIEILSSCGGAKIGRCEKGYHIYGSGDNVNIDYATKTDFFRAMTIYEALKGTEDNFDISAVNNFDSCGIMIDVSRNAVLTVDTVKDIIRYMAKMGLNMLMLYTEDTYKLKEYPYFGYMRGAYTEEELAEIVEYADIFGIECIPCIQTLAHLSKALRWWSCREEVKEVMDTEDILLIDEEKTYDFIECMFKTLRRSFKTDKIHIGMDEAHYVGLGEYLRRHGYTDRFELISKHLKRVCELAEKYDFNAMMWSDMFFRLCSADGGYYDEEKKGLPDNVSKLLPENISMVYWDYYSGDEDNYDYMITTHQSMNRKIIFAGGIWTWGGLSVSWDMAEYTTKPALRKCIEHNIKDVFATMWGDDGAECSIYEALLGMQLYAEYNYSETPEASLDKMFKLCTGLDADTFRLFDIDRFDTEESYRHDAIVSKGVLYQDLLQGMYDKNFSHLDLKGHYGAILKKLDKLPHMGKFEYLFDFHKKLVKTVYLKCDVGIRITEAYKANDRDSLSSICSELDNLLSEYTKLHEAIAKVWYKNNKPFGFETIDVRFGGIEARIKRAKQRITQYLNGEISSLPELEEERLWYGPDNTPVVRAASFERIYH